MRTLLLLFLVGSLAICNGQGYKPGDKVGDLPIKRLLNAQPAGSLSGFKADILVLDFFGTWCVPCIKALPVLNMLQQQQKDHLAVVLVSTEEEKQLQSFIQKRQPFAFPVIVDSQQVFANSFYPPSYPYTVVLGRDRTILAITEASKITTAQVDKWLAAQQTASQQKAPSVVVADMKVKEADANLSSGTPQIPAASINIPRNAVLDLSERFIYAAKTKNDTRAMVESLAGLPLDSLVRSLPTDAEKKAFWINLYNGFTQLRLTSDPQQYANRSAFYKSREMTVAGEKISLDEIEHGILRRSSIKWSLGYLHRWFPSRTEKRLRVSRVDYRIHFALNCGAKSCPPIASYHAPGIEEQLSLASRAYLTGEAQYDSIHNILELPALMSWFRHDFGGRKNMVALAKEVLPIPKNADPEIRFKKYDWTLYLNNYAN